MVLKRENVKVEESPAKSHGFLMEKENSCGSEKENSKEKENGSDKLAKEETDKKLGTLISLLDQIEKEKVPKREQLGGPINAAE